MVKTFPHLKEDDEYYFDALKAQTVIEFIEQFCKLSEPMGQPFKLLPWQRQLINDVFGWYSKATGERRFSYVYVEVPRKNGKTYLLAAILIWLLMGECQGAEVYASACTREQSGLLYKSIRSMIRQSPFLRERLEVVAYKSEIKYANGNGVLKALSGEDVGSHGKYPTAICCDELHEWNKPSAEALYEALTTGFGNRVSPLALHITTAGYGSNPTLAKRMHEKAKLFAQGKCTDPTFYGVVYGAEVTDDWTSEATHRKANPSYELVKKTLNREIAAAKAEPSKQNSFMRLYLNIWTQQQTRWLNLSTYENCEVVFDYESVKDSGPCYLGVDLSRIYDMTAIALLYPQSNGKWKILVRCYLPGKLINKYAKADNIPYDVWQKEGWLIGTEGKSGGYSIDYPTITEDIKAFCAENQVVTVGYDPNGAISVIPELESVGIHTTPIYQRHSDMNHGSKEFERRLGTGEIEIQKNPCLHWQAGNIEVSFRNGLIMPAKPNAEGNYRGNVKYKNDGLVAACIAAQACLLMGNRKPEVEDDGKPQVFFV